MSEAEYWQQHTVLTNDVRNALHSFYIWREIENFAAGDCVALSRMNEHALFWVSTVFAHQTTYIIILGRLFDPDHRSYSIDNLLDETVAHPEYFSKQALARRKRELTGSPDPEWLPQYLEEAWEPKAADLAQLRDAFKPTKQLYRQIYKPIRHKLFAHRDMKVDVNALLSPSRVGDIEQILEEVHGLLECLLQLAHNGMKPTLGTRNTSPMREITETVHAVLRQLTA